MSKALAISAAAARMAAEAMFYNLVLSHFKGAQGPTQEFMRTCLESNLSAGETVSLWSNRFAR